MPAGEAKMCDENTNRDSKSFVSGLTRRDFSKFTVSAAAALSFGNAYSAKDIETVDVYLETPDGVCDALFAYPVTGVHPAVLVWPDILSLRPAFREMTMRLARNGFAVLCVNPYYRSSKAPVVEVGEVFGNASTREKVMPMYRELSVETHNSDAITFVDWLDGQPQTDRNRKVGTMGYCMGGPIVMRTAAARPDRIGAACSFHGGGLVTEESTSPHSLIPRMKAKFLIAIAENDHERDPNAKMELQRAFAQHGLEAEIEVYKGAMHGWCVLDSPVYNEVMAEKAWDRTLDIFSTAL